MSDTNESEEVSESVATYRRYSAEWPWRITSNLEWVVFDDLSDQIMNAQASFFEFARHAEYERFRILPAYENVSIKAFFPTPGRPPMFGEHMFLTNVFTDGKNVTATLNADSIRRDDLKEGQEVTFLIEMVSDWFLVHAGRGIGGFTVPHVWNQLSEDQRRDFQNEPPFAWFLHRGSKSAEDQLVDLPQCVQCHKRNIGYFGDPDDTEQPCGLCRNGSRRCECPKCGAPLIRNEKLPELCIRCAQ